MAGSKKFIAALNLLETEKGIKKEIILDSLKEALEKSYKKNYSGSESVVRVEINEKTGKIRLFEVKEVVDNLNDNDDFINDDYQIELDDAKAINSNYKVGDEVITEVSPDVFGRLAAVQTKQILRQKIREAEKDAIYAEYEDKENEIITGIVDRVEPKFAIINIGNTSAILHIKHQIPGEKLYDGQSIKVYVNSVVRDTKGTQISVSRTDNGLVRRLFEKEVPEIYDGIVEIKNISREPGERSKIAVYSSNPDIDAVGACVGKKGVRVNAVVKEINGEMIDIVAWDKDPANFVINSLAPSKVSSVTIDEEKNTAHVVVPDDQLSLAIGKRGHNAKLAVGLTGWGIDIKSESEVLKEQLLNESDNSKEIENDEVDNEESFEEDTIKNTNEIKEEVENKEVIVEVKEEISKENIEEEKIEEVVKVDSNNQDSNDDDDDDDYDDDDNKWDEDVDWDLYNEYYDD